MGRFHEYDIDDTWSLLAAGRFAANERRVFKSSRGQRLLQEMEDALLRIPGHRLIADSLCEMSVELVDYGYGPVEVEVPEVCALGAWAASRGVSYESMRGEDYEDASIDVAEGLGMTRTMAWIIGYTNDEYSRATPEGRWQQIFERVQRAKETGLWDY